MRSITAVALYGHENAGQKCLSFEVVTNKNWWRENATFSNNNIVGADYFQCQL